MAENFRPLVSTIEDVEALAREVNRDLAGKSLDARMAEAMRRNKGAMHPLWMREALIRTMPNEGGGHDG